jgi:hypothetical protein
MTNTSYDTAKCGSTIAPEFIRLPHPGSKCQHTGLSRSTLNELILPCEANSFKPQVRSVVQKKKYAVRGIRLIHYRSLIDYLNSLADDAALEDNESNK